MFDFNKNLFKCGDKILVGVSGGLDSVVLLHNLLKQCSELKLKLYVVHFNHQLRGKAADRDALFVEKLAAKYKLPFLLGLKDVKKYAADQGLCIEDAARILRYKYFKDVAKELRISKVAVAHNLDDNIETIVMRFLRGAAGKGLSGIPTVRKEGALTIVRPFLGVSRVEIERYAERYKLKHVEDETNKETIYLRNKLRHKLIPLLEKYNPNLKEALLRQADIFQTEDDYLQSKAEEAYRELVITETAELIKLDNKSLAHYPKAIQRRVVRLAIEKLYGYLSTISLLYVENFLENGLSVLEKTSDGLKISK
jgi:tRNA(Ile)-lysidine synthase